MTKFWRALPVAALVLVSAACSAKDADKKDLEDALTKAGVEEPLLSCVVNGLVDEFGAGSDEFNEIARAVDPNDINADVRNRYEAVITACENGESPGSTTSTTRG